MTKYLSYAIVAVTLAFCETPMAHEVTCVDAANTPQPAATVEQENAREPASYSVSLAMAGAGYRYNTFAGKAYLTLSGADVSLRHFLSDWVGVEFGIYKGSTTHARVGDDKDAYTVPLSTLTNINSVSVQGGGSV